MVSRTPTTIRVWSTLATLALLGAMLGLGTVGPDSAGAGVTPDAFNELYDSYPVQVNGDYIPIVGDFDCDDVEQEIIWYAPGPAPDYHWDITGYAGGTVQYTSTPLTINGTYEPFVVQWDDTGNCDFDVFWYAPGTGRDYIWDVDTPGDFGYETDAVTVNGDYTPVATRLDPGTEGIYWYRPGSATDYAWSLPGDGTMDAWVPPQVSGTYQPIAAESDTGRGILWYAPGTGQDWFWRGLTIGSQATPDANVPVTINGTYDPHSTLPWELLYGPGRAPDFLIIDITEATGEVEAIPGEINGTYTVATSPTRDVIVWHRPGSGTDYIWEL